MYFWKNTLPLQENKIIIENDEQEIAKENTDLSFTQDYLVSSQWGQEEAYGMQIKFHSDGTFDEHFAAETGDLPVSGSFEIIDNKLILNVETYGGATLDVAKEKYGNNVGYIPDRTLLLRKSNSSLLYTDYLEHNGRIVYWNRSYKVPEGEQRQYESYNLIITHKNLKPKIDAKVKANPYPSSSNYSFIGCDPSCETGPEHSLSEIYTGVIARTNFMDELHGAENYWYLVNITLPMYSIAKLNNEISIMRYGWIHGSELE